MKRIIAGVVLLSAFVSPPAVGSPGDVPGKVQVADVAGDANNLDQNLSLPVQPSDVYDILKVWFTNDARTLSAHILTAGDPRESQRGVNFQIRTDARNAPQGGRTALTETNDCYVFAANFPGVEDPGFKPRALFADNCDDSEYIELAGHLAVNDAGNDGTITTITVRRSATPSFLRVTRLKLPWAFARQSFIPFNRLFVGLPFADSTPFGSTYRLH